MRTFSRGMWLAGAVATSMAVAGCGGDDSGESGSSEDEAAAVAAVTTLYDGIAGGDGEQACSVLSEDALAQIESESTGLPEDVSCEDALGQIGGLLNEEAKQAIQDVEPEVQEIDGDSAVVEVPVINQVAPGAGGEVEQQTGEIQLAKEGDEWKLTELPENPQQ